VFRVRGLGFNGKSGVRTHEQTEGHKRRISCFSFSFLKNPEKSYSKLGGFTNPLGIYKMSRERSVRETYYVKCNRMRARARS
jgi:hypothetical protein